MYISLLVTIFKLYILFIIYNSYKKYKMKLGNFSVFLFLILEISFNLVTGKAISFEDEFTESDEK